jgi:hypothetical protein
MKAIDFLKEGGDVATGPSREDAIRWKPTDSEGRAWAVSPETWEAEAALKIKNFLNDKWLGIKDKFGMEITPEELEEWQSRNFVVDNTPKVIIDDNGVPQWNPEWRSIAGDTAAEHTLAQQTKLNQRMKEYLDSLVPADDNDEQDYASQTLDKTTQIRPDRTVDRSKGRTSRGSRE